MTFIDEAIMSYFGDTEPNEWSYQGFLEKLKPFILVDDVSDADLESIRSCNEIQVFV
jgi:hypothetical protein